MSVDCPQPRGLRDYALIADGERGALLDSAGELVWLCAPRWDSPAVFAALIGGRGRYAARPVDDWFVGSGHYEPSTLIWHSRWTTSDAMVECHEALAFPAEPGRVLLLRRIVAERGRARVRVLFEPRADFGTRGLDDLQRTTDGWAGRSGPVWFRWSGATDARPAGAGVLCLTIDLPEGAHHDLVLELSETPRRDTPPVPGALWRSTRKAWRAAVPDCADTLAPGDVRHSYAVLRGLTSSAGGMVAAATTSLPERTGDAGDVGNYDYRYAWIRDQCFAGQAVATLGPQPLLDSAVSFVSARLVEDGPRLRPAYTVTGEDLPDQRGLPLPGYPGGTNHVGNRARRQFQLDVFGEALLLLATAAEQDRLDDAARQAMRIAADAITDRWTEPDAGIWELDHRQWTHSKLICVAGLRAAAAFVPAATATDYRRLAERILSDTEAGARHPDGWWRRYPGADETDAALLLPALRGAVPAGHPSTVATVREVRARLARDGYVYRFRPCESDPDRREDAFLLCGFIMALATCQQGSPVEAVRWFERNRAACGPPGLFAEEYDVEQRQLRGNLPQAFVHGMMIEAAARLATSCAATTPRPLS